MIALEKPSRLRELKMRTLTVAEYHALIGDGTLGPDDKVELIRGRLVDKMSKNHPHVDGMSRINRYLQRLLDDNWFLTPEGPIALADSVPEPDFFIRRSDTEGRRSTPADCLLVIEVSDSSLRVDRVVMKELYAEAGIPTYWIVNIPDRQVEVYEGPTPAGEYARQTTYRDGQSVPVVLAGQTVGSLVVSEILPRVESA